MTQKRKAVRRIRARDCERIQNAGSSYRASFRHFEFFHDFVCVLRYDNEAGKGDHKHIGTVETAYVFESPRRLLADFWHDVDLWRAQHE